MILGTTRTACLHSIPQARSCQVLVVAGFLAFSAFLVGCSTPEQSKASAATAPAPVPVTVAEVSCKQIGEVDEFTGHLEAPDTVEVRPRVSGYLQRVLFKEGSIVQKGDVLFLIDPRPFQAEVDRLQGDLAQAKAESQRAENDFQRAERLHNNDGMSKEEYDRRNSARAAAVARIASIEGSLRGAQLNLEFTRITAPITGRVGRAEITEGNLVEAGANQKPLTTLVSLDPLYAYFDADQQTFLKYAKGSRAGGHSRELGNTVLLALSDSDNFNHVGHVSFIDNQVNATTGTIRVRATFSNKDLALTPGLFARVRLEAPGSYMGCLTRDESVVTDLNQKYVFVVGKNNTLEYRAVQIGPISEGLRVIRKGLNPGDVVVVDGIQRVRPGSPVTPKKVALSTANSDSTDFSTQSAAAVPNQRRSAKAHP